MPVKEQEFAENDPLPQNVETKGKDDADFDWRSPWRSRATGALRARAMDHHAERSGRARSMDALYNAPVAPDYATWREQPNRYDIPGVDTIPAAVRRRRADRFLDQLRASGAVKRVKDVDEDEKDLKKGSFKPSSRTLRVNPDLEDDDENYPQRARSFTIAHEGGHALDRAVGEARDRDEGYAFSEMGWSLVGTYHYDRVDPDLETDQYDPELAESFKTLSERARGRWNLERYGDDDDDLLKRWEEHKDKYRGGVDEMFADAAALAVLEPRAARREAPHAFDTIKSEGFGWLEAELEQQEGSGDTVGDLEEFV